MYVFKKSIVYLFGLCFHGDNNYPEYSIGEFGVYNYITYVKEFEPHDVPASSLTAFRTTDLQFFGDFIILRLLQQECKFI